MLTYQSITRKASHLSYCSDIHPDLGRTAGSRERERERGEQFSCCFNIGYKLWSMLTSTNKIRSHFCPFLPLSPKTYTSSTDLSFVFHPA